MAKDFRATGLRVTRILGSGSLSGGGLAAGSGPAIAIYSASVASDFSGGVQTAAGATDTVMFSKVGNDVFLFVSGSQGSKVAQANPGNNDKGVTLFGGDVVISGTMYAEHMVVDVEESVTGSLWVSGSLYVSRSADIGQGLTVNSQQGHLSDDDFRVKANSINDALYVNAERGKVGIWTDTGLPGTLTVGRDAAESFENGDASIFILSPSLTNFSASLAFAHMDSGDPVKKAEIYTAKNTNSVDRNPLIISASQVSFLSGAGDLVNTVDGTDPAKMADVVFYVSGVVGSDGSATRGTSLFGGDLRVSGGLHTSLYHENPGTSTRALEFTSPLATGENSIAMGSLSTAVANYSVVGGGYANKAGDGSSDDYITIAGGQHNTASVDGISIGGGSNNKASSLYATIGGGYFNTGSGGYSAIAGGYYNRAASAGQYSFIGAGNNNLANEDHTVIGGGGFNTASAEYTVIGGGFHNKIKDTSADYAAILGGQYNSIDDLSTHVLGTVIIGGRSNTGSNGYGFIGNGQYNQVIGSDSPYSTVINGTYNLAEEGATVINGHHNTASDGNSIIGGGSYNVIGASGQDSGIFGGQNNLASAQSAFIGAGGFNTASAGKAVVVGGTKNVASTARAFVGAGQSNTGSGLDSFVGSGERNVASGRHSAVLAGSGSTASGAGVILIGSELTGSETGTVHIGGGGRLDEFITVITSSLTKIGNFKTSKPHFIGVDTNLFVSGAIQSRGTSTRGTSVFGGDLYVSGGLSVAGTLSGFGWVDDGTVVRLETATDRVGVGTSNPVSAVEIQNTDASTGHPTLMLTANAILSSSVAFRKGANSTTLGALVLDGNEDMVLVQSGSGDIVLKSAGGLNYFIGDIPTTGASQVLILSGTEPDSTSPDPRLFTDCNFYVSGAIGQRLVHPSRGTAVFGGDTVISGNLYISPESRTGAVVRVGGDIFITTDNDVIGRDDGTTRYGNFQFSNTSTQYRWGGNDQILIKSTGEVGIATTSPLGILDVKGDGEASQVFLLSGSGASSHANESSYTDLALFVSGAIGSKDTSVKGTSVFGGDVVISGSLFGGSPLKVGASLAVAGDTAFSGSVVFSGSSATVLTGSATLTGSMTITGSLTISGSDTLTVYGPSIFNADQNASNDFQVKSSTSANMLYVDSSTNRVGIGTNTPNHTLSVVGAISASLGLSGSLTQLVDGTSYLAAGTNVTITSASNGQIVISSTGGGGAGSGVDVGWLAPGAGRIATTGSVAISGSNLDIAQDIRHIGDTNTKIGFGTDTITLSVGGVDYFKSDAADTSLTLNPSGVAIDTIIKTSNKNAIVTAGSTDKVLILSGGGVTSRDEAAYGDTCFFVSGTVGSRGTSVAGTSVFGGDAMISGSLHTGNSILPTIDSTYNLGSETKRWANIYTGDLHLRNDKGDWTIVEERDNLIVVNNITGKKFKMMLEPIIEE
tara:strand:- start:2100 stop:6425 length:4326 start_codon:yes stop_codon:yes gene_type:complete